MKYYVNTKDVKAIETTGQTVYKLLNEINGCSGGCYTGITIYALSEYMTPGIHDDQEGFVVLEGTGWALVGDEEFRIEPEMSFIVPARTRHSIKREIGAEYVKVFWFHCAI